MVNTIEQLVDISSQLVEIYFKEEHWHSFKMSPESALRYHKTRYDNGSIYVYEEDGEVLGYYERYFDNDKCFLYNVWVKETQRKGKVFKELYKHFFKTMPENIKYVVGDKVKLGGKYQKVLITRERRNGYDKN